MPISERISWLSAFFMAVALFYAPLAYGCTRPDMLPALFGLLAAFMVTGVISFMAEGRWPRISKVVLVSAAALLVQGWWIAFNPVFPSIVSDSGGYADTSLDNIRRLSIESMTMTSFLLGAFVVLCGLLGQPHLRRFLLLAAALSGVLICVIGVDLKLTGAPLMKYFWNPMDIYWNDFAFYRYHGNAGAFLNLVWPLILVFTRRAYTPTIGHFKKVVWTIATLACGASLFLNASKAALVIGLLILPWPFLSRLQRYNWKILVLLAVGSLMLIAAGLIVSARMTQEAAFQRIINASEVNGSFTGRIDSYRQNLDAVPEVGFFGLGPGLFKIAFPYQLSPMRNAGESVHDYAHQDYLQTVLEWGWLGTFWWSLLVAGGLYRAIKSYSQRELFTSKTERHLLLAAMLGVGGTLAQSFVDFPLQIASLRLFFLLLLALCWASPRLLTKPPEDLVPWKRYRLPIPAELLTTSSR